MTATITIHEQERPEQSSVLGPDGRPLRYEKPALGFDLTRRKEGKDGKPEA
jgi:hypothetical protein